MNKICTDINQSKKLIELGVDINTADMYWDINTAPVIFFPLHEIKADWVYAQANGIVPCWSLATLISLMPTDDKKDEYYVDTESHSDYHIVNYRNCWDGCIHSEYSEESLLDAAFKMVVWLKENGRL